MTRTLRIALAALATTAALVACSGGEPAATGDAPLAPDSSGGTVTLPTWRLEDLQPQSPRAGQIYGLDTFSGKTVVVALLEGF